MIKQFDWKFSANNELFADLKVTDLLDNKKPMTKMFRYDLEFNEDTHWKLVQLSALKKMHQEDFVEELLTCVMEVLLMDEEKEEEKEDIQANHIGNSNKMVPLPALTDEELREMWDRSLGLEHALRATYILGVAHGQASSREVAEPAPVEGGLMERVKLAIDSALYDEDDHQWNEGRAAILEVAKWLREQGTPASGWAMRLEQEAGR